MKMSHALMGVIAVFLAGTGFCQELSLPEGWTAGPEPDAKIVYTNGLPMIRVAGRLLEPDWNINGTSVPWGTRLIGRFHDVGVDFAEMRLTSDEFETVDGRFEFSALDRSARRAIRANPDVLLMLSVRFYMNRWLKAHPEEAVAYAAGPVREMNADEHRGRPFRPSAASLPFRVEACRAMAELCDYIRRQPWCNRVVSIRPCWGVYKEWHVFGMWDGPDVGPAMTAAFRRYKNGKWANAAPPTMEERKTENPLLDPVKDAKLVDFYACQQKEVADLAAALAHEVKAHLPGRLVGMWYGYVLTGLAPEGANVLLDRMLSNPDIDWLSDPAEYDPRMRRAGGAYLHRTIPATFHRYGKLAVLEDDTRYDNVKPWSGRVYLLRSPEESRAVIQRNYLSKLFDRGGIQFNDAERDLGARPYAFDDDNVLAGLSSAMRAFREVRSLVGEDSGLDTALVVDYRGRLLWNHHLGARSRELGVLFGVSPQAASASGAAYELLTLDDYLATARKFRKVVFMNLFHPKSSHLEGVRAKLARDAAVAVRMTPEGCPALDLGVRTVVPAATPLTGEAWAMLFRQIGVHVYTKPGNCFRRTQDLILFNTGVAGIHEVTLPVSDGKKSFVDTLSGVRYNGPVLRLSCEGPRTWLLKAAR